MRHWHVEWCGPLTHTHIHTSVIPYFFKSQDLCVDKATLDNCYRLETYCSAGSISASANQQLRCHFISKCNSPKNPPPLSRTDGKTDILTVSDPSQESNWEHNLDIPECLVERRGLFWPEVFEVEGTCEQRLVIGTNWAGQLTFPVRCWSCITFTHFFRHTNTSVRPILCAFDHTFNSYRRSILEWGHYHFDLSQSTPQLEGSPIENSIFRSWRRSRCSIVFRITGLLHLVNLNMPCRTWPTHVCVSFITLWPLVERDSRHWLGLCATLL